MKYSVGQSVTVAARERDPGGRGKVTARKTEEFDDGSNATAYRVDIPDHARQNLSREKKGKKFKGFWYPEDLVSD
jgi:hypothetical protein